MNVHDLIATVPKLHYQDGELTSAWKLGDEELLFLDRRLDRGMKTIETGAGVSTIVFAIKETNHKCIVPDSGQEDRIRSYCEANRIPSDCLEFIIDTSESALPKIHDANYDLAIIDGRHGFPTPFIDWFYLAGLLKVGGILIVDDLHIWTCETLFRFLLSESDWRLIEESVNAAAFEKCGVSFEDKEWVHQAFVFRRSRAASARAKIQYLLGLMKRRNWLLFRRAVSLGVWSALAGRFGDRGRR